MCGAGAVGGDSAGVVIVCAKEPPKALCAKFGCDLIGIHGEPLGARIVG